MANNASTFLHCVLLALSYNSLSLLLPQQAASASAPGDADTFCLLEQQQQQQQRRAELPGDNNVVVLMDSYNYITLLSEPGRGGVWQQVDLDSNNEVGRGTMVRM